MAEDWEYSQRWEIQKVFPSIFISSFKPARDRELLHSLGITAVLILKDEKETFVKENFKDLNYSTVILENSVYTNLLPILKKTNEIVREQISKGGKVLVHCLGGISRAPAVVVGYLINEGMTFDQAYQTVQNNRFCINPIESFVNQLRAYDQLMEASRMSAGQESFGMEKRKDGQDHLVDKKRQMM